ncbi:type II secretion system GspH family protein [Bacillus sp. FJAT-29790]|uniref:competence type IV pilus minor pilin ComGD n=1 Tax=Bacillus sp. FJAT-29790 TaxID=1895002 RepID=UPI001C23C272|nr:competence type IV pilus minor pilin ComGD [Bacillus sp. FJAT-29790]MBU8879367.1 type II secretion system GspH family protein [Bacillus sp. FJAT-29790]
MKSSEGGFTLLESLFVLSVFLIIASISGILIKPQFLFLEKQLFFTQLKSDLYFAQSYAISHQSEVNVNIVPEKKMYYIRTNFDSGDGIIRREYPDLFTVEKGSMKIFFHFTPNGTVNQFGSFYINAGKEKYRFTFLIGMGRFYVAKE